jgi:L-2-hydroxycarboxylate dehydrogenase (NAD+)
MQCAGRRKDRPHDQRETRVVENAPLPPGTKRYDPAVVQSFLAAAFREVGIGTDDAALIAEVLVGADLRGVRSHGAARLTYFLNYLERGTINVKPKMVFTQKTDTTGLLDADNGMGIIAAGRAMDEAMTMAGKHGTGFVAVANSSHFGYAGYWAERAMRKGFVGISMSNSGGRTAPTYSSEGMLGTNPFSVGINGGEGGTNFLLDMATTTVAVGKIETALREGREIPEGWVSEARGKPALDAKGVLKHDIPLLPLGGAGTEHGGHKGYGLNLMIELLCGAMTGTPFADRIAGADGTSRPAMGHLFGAIQIGGFREPTEVHADMQETFRILRGAEKEPGQDRVYIHGEPEAIATAENRKIGIPITPKILEQLHKVAERLRINDTL